MRIETVERSIHRLGGWAALAASVAVYSGLLRGMRHPRGRIVGTTPAVVKAFTRGSPAVFIPLTVGSLGFLYALWRPLTPGLSGAPRLAATIAGAMLYFPGLALMVWGRVNMGEMHNVSTTVAVELYADHRLVTSGPFAWVRHPMYVGGILAELGALLLYRTWTALLIAFNVPILMLRARLEEQALAAEFGEQWADYQSRVPMWIPRFGR